MREQVRSAVMGALEALAAGTGTPLPELLDHAVKVTGEERAQRGYVKFTRVSANTTSLVMDGIDGERETYSITERPGFVSITFTPKGRRAQTVRPDSAQWKKVMHLYRQFMAAA